jgi:hypothetical protein
LIAFHEISRSYRNRSVAALGGEATRFFGGAPRCVIVDNLEAVVTRADRYAPTIGRVSPEHA